LSLVPGVIAFGIYSACLLAIGAVGFSLQFGITNVLNLSYGSIMTSAVFVDYYVVRGSANIWLGLAVGAASGALLSWIVGQFIVSAFVRRGTSLFGMAMVTIGLGLVIQFSLEAIQGPGILAYQTAQTTTVGFAGVVMSIQQLVIIAVAVGLMLVVHGLLRHTKLGLGMRATASDPSLTRNCGVSTKRIRAVAWLCSGALCGICGVFLGISQGAFDSTTGANFFITLAAAAIIGGIGKPYGAMVGALIIGIVSQAAAASIAPSYKDIVAWAMLIIVLMVRPQGIFAEYAAERELVG